jgi:hypothetical protein
VQIFAFDPTEFRETFERQGWVHIPGGISPDFLAGVQRFIADSFDDARIAARSMPGKKEQSLFEFPGGMDYERELFDVVAALTGLERATMTLSERHINGYDGQADPNPVPHKDRYASQISVGLSIQIPTGSQLVLYPFDHLELNPFNTAAELYDSLPADQKPEIVMRSAREVVIDDRPGDVVAFHGNKTWHLRRNSANSYNLYLKFNDFDCDPLGEDSRTPRRRAATLAALGGDDIGGLFPVVSRRLDYVTRVHARHEWIETSVRAKLWGLEEVALTPSQFHVLKSLRGGRDVEGLAESIESADPKEVVAAVRTMAATGVIDLLAAPLGADDRAALGNYAADAAG